MRPFIATAEVERQKSWSRLDFWRLDIPMIIAIRSEFILINICYNCYMRCLYSTRSVGNYMGLWWIFIQQTYHLGGVLPVCVCACHTQRKTRTSKPEPFLRTSRSALSFLVDSKNCPQFKFASMNTKWDPMQTNINKTIYSNGKSPFFMGKSTISMAIYTIAMLVHQRVYGLYMY